MSVHDVQSDLFSCRMTFRPPASNRSSRRPLLTTAPKGARPRISGNLPASNKYFRSRPRARSLRSTDSDSVDEESR